MSNASGGERIVFHDRVLELQDKLKKSEEERLRLEAQFEVMMIAAREEEAARLLMLRGKYEKIVECEKRRRDRNDQILHTLDRIESRTAMIVAKSERLQLLRRHYEAYVASIYPAWNGNAISSGYNGFTVPHIQSATQLNHHPPRNGARSPTLQQDPRLFPLNPVKGAYISPYPSQNPFDLIPGSLTQILQTPVYEQQVPTHQEGLVPPLQYSNQSIPLVNQPLPPMSQLHPNAPYQTQSVSPKQNPLYPSPVTPKNYSQKLSRSYDDVDKTSNDYRRRNLFPDEPYKFQDISAKPAENGINKYFSGLDTNEHMPRNETNLELNDYMKKTADLLNYTMRDYGKESSKIHNEEESKLANSTDFEQDQNTSGDILNVSLSDDGVMNEEVSMSKTQGGEQDILEIAHEADEGLKSRKVVQFHEGERQVQKGNTVRESDARAKTAMANRKQNEFGQGDRPETSGTRERSLVLDTDRTNEKHEISPVEHIPENEEIQGNFSESLELDKNQEFNMSDNEENKGKYNGRESRVDSGIGREDFDGNKSGQQEDQAEDDSELKDSQYLDRQSANIGHDQEDAGVEQYENSAVQDQEYEAEQLQKHGEFAEADESTGYVAEPQYANDQLGVEQMYGTEDQGEYVAQDQEYIQGEDEYVTQNQHGAEPLDNHYQGQYETGGEELTPQEGILYEDGEYQQQYQGQDGQYEVDQTQYQADDESQYAVDNQGQYVEDQTLYEQGQPQYDETQSGYAEGQNQYEYDQNQYAEQQEQYSEDPSQYAVQDDGQYVQEGQEVAGGQDQYSTENQVMYQEGYDGAAAAYQEYPQQQSQEYAEGGYEVETEGTLGESQQWQGEQGGEVYFEEGKYHEPTAGYERDEIGGEYLADGDDGTVGHEIPESSQEQGYYDEMQEYSGQDQGGVNVGESQELVGNANQYNMNDDTSASSAIVEEQNVGGNEGANLASTKPRKSGLAMLESDTESSSAHLGNVAISNEDSDFDFSSGK